MGGSSINLSSADKRFLETLKCLPSDKGFPNCSMPVKGDPSALSAELLQISWRSAVPVSRNETKGITRNQIKEPHWEKGGDVKEDDEQYRNGSKKPGVYLFQNNNNGDDKVDAVIKLKTVKGVTGRIYLRGSLPCVGKGEELRFEGIIRNLELDVPQKVTLVITNLPSSLQHYEGDSTWDVLERGDVNRFYGIAEKPRLEVFVIHDKPPAFYTNGRDGSLGVWVEAMRLMFKKAKVTGLKDPDEISAKVTGYCHSEHGMVYDTTRGKHRFAQHDGGGLFKLLNYIKKRNDRDEPSNTVNCYDQAAAVQAFSGCLGVETKWRCQETFGYLNKTFLVGIGQCNNPLFNAIDKGTGTPKYSRKPVTDRDDPKRSSFSTHTFVLSQPGSFVRDACVGPHITAEDLRRYLMEAVDLERSGKREAIYALSAANLSPTDYFDAVSKIEASASLLYEYDYLDMLILNEVKNPIKIELLKSYSNLNIEFPNGITRLK